MVILGMWKFTCFIDLNYKIKKSCSDIITVHLTGSQEEVILSYEPVMQQESKSNVLNKIENTQVETFIYLLFLSMVFTYQNVLIPFQMLNSLFLRTISQTNSYCQGWQNPVVHTDAVKHKQMLPS